MIKSNGVQLSKRVILLGSQSSNFNFAVLMMKVIVSSILLYTILISAWLTDDALISFRHIWNFISGDGITFNYGERVQGFSHPLWFLLLSSVSIFSQDLLLTSIVVSIILSFASCIFLLYVEYNICERFILTPVLLLPFSFAFCDFTSSGLENPLSYFLVGVIFLLISRNNILNHRNQLYIIFSLLILTRLDYFLLILPMAIFLAVSDFEWKIEKFKKLLFDMIPSIVIILTWIVFSIIYFGFPLPNTYYAKLNAGFPLDGFIIRGFYYYFDMIYDPASIVIIVSGLVLSFYSRSKLLLYLSLGMILYLIYIMYIGGDFMRGRFFSVIVYMSVGQIIMVFSIKDVSKNVKKFGIAFILGLIIICSFTDIRYPFMSTENYTGRLRHDADKKLGVGMQDERGFFYSQFGLFSPYRRWSDVKDQLDEMPRDYGIYCGHLGALSLFGKSENLSINLNGEHLIDFCALTDPLLSKIPAIEDKYWRIGHNIRKIPTDYGEFSIGNINELPDKNLKKFSADISIATRGELFTKKRFSAIWRLNTGYYGDLDFREYVDPLVWIPKTTKFKSIQIENWEVEVEEYERPNLYISSKIPKLSTGLSFSLNPSYAYEIQVNEELIATDQISDVNRELHISFDHPILVNSVRIETIGLNEKRQNKRWWIYTYRDKIKFLRLWNHQ